MISTQSRTGVNQTRVASCAPAKGRGAARVGGSAVGCPALGAAIQKVTGFLQKHRTLPRSTRSLGATLPGFFIFFFFFGERIRAQRRGVKSLSPHGPSETASGPLAPVLSTPYDVVA